MVQSKQIDPIRRLLKEGKTEQASTQIDTLIKKHGERPILLALKGFCLASSNHHWEALGYYAKSLEGLPRDSTLLYNISFSATQTGHFKTAEEAIQKAIRIAPKNPVFTYQLARVQTHQKEHAQAILSLYKSIEIDPTFLPAYLALEIYLILDNQVNLAIKLYQAGLESSLDNQFLKNRLAELQAL